MLAGILIKPGWIGYLPDINFFSIPTHPGNLLVEWIGYPAIEVGTPSIADYEYI